MEDGVGSAKRKLREQHFIGFVDNGKEWGLHSRMQKENGNIFRFIIVFGASKIILSRMNRN